VYNRRRAMMTATMTLTFILYICIL